MQEDELNAAEAMLRDERRLLIKEVAREIIAEVWRHEESQASLSVREAAMQLNCSQESVRRMIACGRLGSHRIGKGRGCLRVTQEDIKNCRDMQTKTPAVGGSSKRRRHLGID